MLSERGLILSEGGGLSQRKAGLAMPCFPSETIGKRRGELHHADQSTEPQYDFGSHRDRGGLSRIPISLYRLGEEERNSDTDPAVSDPDLDHHPDRGNLFLDYGQPFCGLSPPLLLRFWKPSKGRRERDQGSEEAVTKRLSPQRALQYRPFCIRISQYLRAETGEELLLPEEDRRGFTKVCL